MPNKVFLFAIQGMVWLDEANKLPYKEADLIIKCENKRNGVKDEDYIGENVGECGNAGWFSLTLADMATESAAATGDTIEFGLFLDSNHKIKKYDLGTYTLTSQDLDMCGVVLKFDLSGKKPC